MQILPTISLDRTFSFLIISILCIYGLRIYGQDPPPSALEYIQNCIEEISEEPPVFTCKVGNYTESLNSTNRAKWNRIEVVDIPVYQKINGQYVEITRDDLLSGRLPDKPSCVNPAFLTPIHGHCVPGSTLGAAYGVNKRDEKVVWSHICRSIYIRPASSKKFEVVSTLAFNFKTKKACVFEAVFPKKFAERTEPDGERVSIFYPTKDRDGNMIPSTATDSDDFGHELFDIPSFEEDAISPPENRLFFDPVEIFQREKACFYCHSNGPFVRNGYIIGTDPDSIFKNGKVTEGEPLIPRPVKKNQVSEVIPVMWDRFEPYINEILRKPSKLKVDPSKNAAECFSCHDLGNNRYCESILPLNLGLHSGENTWIHEYIKPTNLEYWENVSKRFQKEGDRSIVPGVHSFIPDSNLFKKGLVTKYGEDLTIGRTIIEELMKACQCQNK